MPVSRRERETPIRVMHLIPRYISDGTCRMVNSLVKYTDRARFQTFVGILSRDGVPLEPLIDMGATPIQFDMGHFADFSVVAQLVRELRARQIRILHTHRIRPDLVGRVAGRLAGVPVNVSTQHYTGEWDERGKAFGRLVHFLYRLTLPLTQRIVNISRGEMELLEARGVPGSLMEVIYNGVDGGIFFPTPPAAAGPGMHGTDRPLVVGCVAFLTKRKGISNLIAAFRQVADRYPQACLKIAGEGEERYALQGQIDALGLTEKVTLLGSRLDIPELMNEFDVFVLPSLWEPFGLVIAEAMACGKPVVATHVGGIPEIVEHDVTGLLVPPEQAAPLAGALITLLGDSALRARMGEAGRRRYVAQFDAKVMADRYQALYAALL